MTQVAGPMAALAGVPAGVQAQGLWSGRRQLFIRFAAEAETATMYTADALVQEIRRTTSRWPFHSISIAGRDPLANADFLRAFLERGAPAPRPIMLDHDGQRPAALEPMVKHLALVQVTLDPAQAGDAGVENAMTTLATAARHEVAHALVLVPDERASDGPLLRVVEQAQAASAATSVVLHPPAAHPLDQDRRWVTWLERASEVHGDVQIKLRLPAPTGMR